jgi:hypothetical protein
MPAKPTEDEMDQILSDVVGEVAAVNSWAFVHETWVPQQKAYRQVAYYIWMNGGIDSNMIMPLFDVLRVIGDTDEQEYM